MCSWLLTSVAVADTTGATTEPAREPTAATEPTPAAIAEPIDGVWTMSLTYDELAEALEVSDAGDINNQNSGDSTFRFDDGSRFTYIHRPNNPQRLVGDDRHIPNRRRRAQS
jgi:hypothetical protein